MGFPGFVQKNTHCPPGASEAKARSTDFIRERMPKFLGYFERVLQQNPRGDRYLVGSNLSYGDLSLFQIVEGLVYAFPKAMTGYEARYPLIAAVRDMVAGRPNIAAYLHSERRIAFNEDGIFRHYSELDMAG